MRTFKWRHVAVPRKLNTSLFIHPLNQSILTPGVDAMKYFRNFISLFLFPFLYLQMGKTLTRPSAKKSFWWKATFCFLTVFPLKALFFFKFFSAHHFLTTVCSFNIPLLSGEMSGKYGQGIYRNVVSLASAKITSSFFSFPFFFFKLNNFFVFGAQAKTRV